MIKHIEPLQETVRVVLPEAGAKRVRVSGRAKSMIEKIAAERGCPEWMVIDDILGVQ